jgi:PAS domain S-box-containing protein
MVMEHPAEHLINQTLVGEAWVNASLPMLIVDDDGHYVATNESVCKLTGYTHTELMGLRAGQDLAGDAASRTIYAALERGKRMQGRKLVRCKDGALVPCRYWGIRTSVGKMGYFILMLWAPGTAS